MRRPSVAVIVVAGLAALAVAVAPAPGANACRPTPTDSFGPFGRGTPPQRSKIGTGHVLTGTILSALDCKPLVRARVELWQADRNGRYTRASSATVITDRAGRFRFEGPYPTRYSGGPAHIHLRVVAAVHEPLLTRYVAARGARRGTVRLVLAPQAL
jgi:protocatechuate 3,4-dioxygenase beta subunit